MPKTTLNAEELKILQNHQRTSPIGLVRNKALSIVMSVDGLSYEKIAYYTNSTERTICTWIKAFSTYGISSVFSGKAGNQNGSKLSRQQKEELKDLLTKEPSEYGLPREFWDVPQLKKYIETRFSVVYNSDRSYQCLLRYSGFSFKYPAKVNPRFNEKVTKARIKEIRKELCPYMADQEIAVFAQDEVGIKLESEIHKAWIRRGETTSITTERSSEHQNYSGFLNQKTGVCEVFEIERGTNQETIRVLRILLQKYPQKKLCIVWDNAAFHRGKELRALLGEGNEFARIHLINFPTYAPKYNPIEHVWSAAKRKISNITNKNMTQVKQNFVDEINSRTFRFLI